MSIIQYFVYHSIEQLISTLNPNSVKKRSKNNNCCPVQSYQSNIYQYICWLSFGNKLKLVHQAVNQSVSNLKQIKDLQFHTSFQKITSKTFVLSWLILQFSCIQRQISSFRIYYLINKIMTWQFIFCSLLFVICLETFVRQNPQLISDGADPKQNILGSVQKEVGIKQQQEESENSENTDVPLLFIKQPQLIEHNPSKEVQESKGQQKASQSHNNQKKDDQGSISLDANGDVETAFLVCKQHQQSLTLTSNTQILPKLPWILLLIYLFHF